jgi:hypothetical protein
MPGLFIEEDTVCTKTIPAEPEFNCPEVKVAYRQALARVRTEHQYAAKQSAEAVSVFENAILSKYVVGLNGEKVTPYQVGRIQPKLRDKVLNLILCYDAPDEPAGATSV